MQSPHIGCTPTTELKGLSSSMIPQTRQISGTKDLHAALKVFGTWIWVRKEGKSWELETKENNKECLRSISHFLCQHCPIQETNRKVILTFDGRSMKLTLYSSWTSKHLANKTLKATRAPQFGTSSKKKKQEQVEKRKCLEIWFWQPRLQSVRSLTLIKMESWLFLSICFRLAGFF